MPGTGGVPGDAVTLRAENARLRMLLEDKDAQICAFFRYTPGRISMTTGNWHPGA
jgi:hypothetical protein